MKADRYRYDDHDRPDLRDLPTHAGVDKDCREEIEEKTAENIETMKELQDALYADGREGIVIVLQAMDAAGKDSTIKHVMSGLNPQGVMVHSFKQPGAEELAHDYLWRVVQHLPPRGSIAIFNRSHYEDVLAVQILDLWKNYQMPDRVLRDSREEFFHKRYRQIRQFEEYLYENGYRVVKIFLHVSKEEQGKRFLERIEEPEKNWKFSSSDLETRERFEEYTDLYEEVIRETASDHAPWYVLPADQKWYTRYLVSEILVDLLRQCDPRYPELSETERSRLAEARDVLLREQDKKDCLSQAKGIPSAGPFAFLCLSPENPQYFYENCPVSSYVSCVFRQSVGFLFFCCNKTSR